jgi:uncharacterized protein
MATSRPTALVTGASAGIGLELARILAREGHDLVLVARRQTALEELAAELKERYGADCTVVAADLARPEAGAHIEQAIAGTTIDVLVNNAGFGGVGAFAQREHDADMRMVAVNVVALTDLTKRFLPGMVARGRGRVLNVASTAAFQPGPFMAVYYATKAYVLSLSQALAEETRGTGVTVTCLCPGVTETEFHGVAGTDAQPLTSGPLAMTASSVAQAGYRAMMRGKLVETPGLHNKFGAQSIRVAPRSVVLKVVRRLHPADH